MERRDAGRDLVIAADQSRSRAAIAADARRLLHGLHHDNLGVGILLLDRLHRRILCRQSQQLLMGRCRLFTGFARDDERRKAETERPGMARPRRNVGNQACDVLQRLAIDEPYVAMIGDQRASRRGFTADIDQWARAVEVGGPERVIAYVEMFSLVSETLTLHQARHHRDPLLSVGVARVMLREADAGLFQLRTVPGIDQIDRKPSPADVLDLKRHLGQHHRVIQIRLDGGDDFDAARQCRKRRR